jgi:dolichyl-phosphate beta-glucosyltransferase
LALFVIAPTPRPPFPSERTYTTTTPDGQTSNPRFLPSWHDKWLAHRAQAEKRGDFSDRDTGDIEEAEVVISVVIPAYNEEERLEKMLEEAVEYLDSEYGRPLPSNSLAKKANGQSTSIANGAIKAHRRGNQAAQTSSGPSGYEIILVNDGSSDKTVDVALSFSHKKELHDVMRIVTLKENRGKGGAVIHGFRHVRGQYAIFADADGASRFSDLGSLVEACKEVHDEPGRGVAVGSRAHLVGSDAVVKVLPLSSFLFPLFSFPFPITHVSFQNYENIK